MTFYSCCTLLTCLLMVAISIHVLTYSGFNRIQKTWYTLTFLTITICSLSEFAVHCGHYKPSWAISLTVLTVIQFSLSPMLAVLFSGALGLHKQAKAASWSILVSLIVEVACAPFGLVFYFDESGYHRGDFFIIYEVLFSLGMLYLIVSLVFVGRMFRHRDFLTIIMIVVVLLGGIIPMMFFKVNVTYIAIAISACLCYIYYNDLTQQDTRDAYIANQKRVSEMQTHIISSMSNLIENRDVDTGEHVARTGKYAKIIAENAAKEGVYADLIDQKFIDLLYLLVPLHDIGKIVVSDRILRKPGKLTPEEFEEMKHHASAGSQIVKQIMSGITNEEYNDFASDIAKYHHERWDGTGYPDRLSKEEIPLSARIMAIADVFDALVSERCYKKPFPFDEAVNIIKEESGTHFDPKLVGVFLNHVDEFRDCD